MYISTKTSLLFGQMGFQSKIPQKFLVAAVVFMTAAALVLIFLFSPLFHVSDVIITGNIRTESEEIIGRLRIHETSNLIFFRTWSARERLMENFFIGNVVFRRELPNILHVHIEERRLAAYVEHLGFFLYLDDFGRVVDIRGYTQEPRPTLVGLSIRSFQLGELLDVPDTIAFHAVVHYSMLLYHHGFIERITHLDVSDPDNIRILVNYWEFNMGGVLRADEKIRHMIAMLYAMPGAETARGTTDLSNPGPLFFFEILQ